jgi:hypothetical protein
MDLAVRPEEAVETTDADPMLKVVLDRDEAEGFLDLLKQSRAYDPAKREYLEEAAAFSQRLLRSGRLPD